MVRDVPWNWDNTFPCLETTRDVQLNWDNTFLVPGDCQRCPTKPGSHIPSVWNVKPEPLNRDNRGFHIQGSQIPAHLPLPIPAPPSWPPCSLFSRGSALFPREINVIFSPAGAQFIFLSGGITARGREQQPASAYTGKKNGITQLPEILPRLVNQPRGRPGREFNRKKKIKKN